MRLRGEKQREADRLRTELEDCQACLAVSQAKEQALTSRKRVLEKEVDHASHWHTLRTLCSVDKLPDLDSCRVG